ncbi:methyltransferase [Streptomyces sp. NPDC059063]|uniref:methyltransferase n=1 Tax=unclassified Streptomyces TaxID=2593676 RepID=UPI003695136E
MRLINGYWATGVLAAAATHGLFTHLHHGAGTAGELAACSKMSPRGAQSLLDALVGIGLVELHQGRYRNTPEAATYLIEDTPLSLAPFARLKLTHTGSLTGLADVIEAGGPLHEPVAEVADNPHWENIVTAIAAQSVPAAHLAARLLNLPDAGPLNILDVGGGSGIYSRLWLQANPAARATQLDWAPINTIARRLIDEHGLGERFTTLNGDFHTTDFGTHHYDIAVYSHIAHQESPASNTEILTRLKQALKPGGTLIINDYIVNNDRTGPPFALIFAAEMLLKTRHGSTWQRNDYHHWLHQAGFTHITFHTTEPTTLILAR